MARVTGTPKGIAEPLAHVMREGTAPPNVDELRDAGLVRLDEIGVWCVTAAGIAMVERESGDR